MDVTSQSGFSEPAVVFGGGDFRWLEPLKRSVCGAPCTERGEYLPVDPLLVGYACGSLFGIHKQSEVEVGIAVGVVA